MLVIDKISFWLLGVLVVRIENRNWTLNTLIKYFSERPFESFILNLGTVRVSEVGAEAGWKQPVSYLEQLVPMWVMSSSGNKFFLKQSSAVCEFRIQQSLLFFAWVFFFQKFLLIHLRTKIYLWELQVQCTITINFFMGNNMSNASLLTTTVKVYSSFIFSH